MPSEGAILPRLFPLPPGVVPAGGSTRLAAETARTAELGKLYPYQLQHCGVGSPIDFDGSLWDVLGAQNGRDAEATEEQVGELINAGSGSMTLVDPDHALFRTSSGLILGLRRHDGPKMFQPCA